MDRRRARARPSSESGVLPAVLGGENPQFLAVLGHGSPRDVDALLIEGVRDLLIAEGLALVLGFDQLADLVHLGTLPGPRRRALCVPVQSPVLTGRFARSFSDREGPLPGMVQGQTSMQMPQPSVLLK